MGKYIKLEVNYKGITCTETLRGTYLPSGQRKARWTRRSCSAALGEVAGKWSWKWEGGGAWGEGCYRDKSLAQHGCVVLVFHKKFIPIDFLSHGILSLFLAISPAVSAKRLLHFNDNVLIAIVCSFQEPLVRFFICTRLKIIKAQSALSISIAVPCRFLIPMECSPFRSGNSIPVFITNRQSSFC